MAKKKLTDLVKKETQSLKLTESESDKETELQTNRVIESLTTEVTESSEPPKVKEMEQKQSYKVPDLQSSEVPKYLSLIRKEARLREEQIEALGKLSRRLNRQRRGKGERITENTLIRVAVDLLLEHSEELAGVTEEEVRDSLQ